MKLFIRAFILLLAMAILISTNVSAENDYANQRESFVALGDSIPYGFNLGDDNSSPSKHAYPYLIGEDAGVRVPNLSVLGWKTEDLLIALETQKYKRTLENADYVSLNIGSNDLLEALFSAWVLSQFDFSKSFDTHLNDEMEESELFSNLQLIILKIRNLTDAPVIIYNVYNPFQTYTPLHDVVFEVLPEINEIFDEKITRLNALLKDIILADAFKAFGTNQAEYVIDDGHLPDIHPTLAGQRKLAEIGLDALEMYKEREIRRQARRDAKELFTQIPLSNEGEVVSRPDMTYKNFAQRIN